jgi:hypothetical protein
MNVATEPSHISPSKGIPDTTKQNSAEGTKRSDCLIAKQNREMRPMGRFSKDTMESPYSARLPSSLFRRKNREDVRSSRNDRWAVSVLPADLPAIGKSLRLVPSADLPAIGKSLRLVPSADYLAETHALGSEFA